MVARSSDSRERRSSTARWWAGCGASATHRAQAGGGRAARGEPRPRAAQPRRNALSSQLDLGRCPNRDRRGDAAQRREVRRVLLQLDATSRATPTCSTRCRARRARRSSSSDSPARRRCSARRSAASRRSAPTTSRRIARLRQEWRPHHGMPAGHLPVRSYLAVPVARAPARCIGGLFFGHPEPGVFTERTERHRRRRRPGRDRDRQRPALRGGAASAAKSAKALLESERARPRRGRAHERDEGRVPRDALARAPHAAERDPRLGAAPADSGTMQRRGRSARASRPSSATPACRRS